MKGSVLVLAGWLALVLLGSALGPTPSTHQNVPRRERADVMLDLFGEFRTVLARYLWFKMDLFHEVLDDEGIDNSKQTEVLPLLRMISLLDPSMVDAYDNIGWDLYHGHQQTEQALGIINEGLSKNPRSFQLNFRKALIFYKEKRMKEALVASEAAVKFAVDEFDRLNSNRLMWRSARNLGEKDFERQALENLRALRPQEFQWEEELKRLEAR